MNYKRMTYKQAEELGYKTYNQLILQHRVPRLDATGMFVFERIYYKPYETEKLYTLSELQSMGLVPVDKTEYIDYHFSNHNIKRFYRISNTKNSFDKEPTQN